MGEILRYERAEDLLNLALAMANDRQGLSIDDIGGQFDVSRRTAERMRDAVIRVFPAIEEKRDNDRVKRWHLPRRHIADLACLSSEDIAALHTATRLAGAQNMEDVQARLQNITTRLKAQIEDRMMERLAPDLEAIIEAEGLAVRQGPRPVINTGNLEALRHAIKACTEIVITYTARGTGKTSWQHVQPYGFLYGHRHYLVAYAPEQEDFRLYSLPNIEAVEIQDTSFERDPDFDLQDYANRSFGVFQEEPVNVIWHVLPEAAEDARHYLFHPTQELEEQADGSLIVRFTAGGMKEMCWELFKWDGCIKVLEPKELANMYKYLMNGGDE